MRSIKRGQAVSNINSTFTQKALERGTNRVVDQKSTRFQASLMGISTGTPFDPGKRKVQV